MSYDQTKNKTTCSKVLQKTVLLTGELPIQQGWKIASKKPRLFSLFKKPKKPQVKNLGFLFFIFFLVKFYTNHIKFHILIVICVFCYILQKCSERE